MTTTASLATTDRASRFEAFLDRLREDVYPEPPSPLHTDLTRQMWERLQGSVTLPAGARILDVGCGQGLALDLFRAAGHHATGITIGAEDLAACAAGGHEVLEMDQSFLEFEDASFDLIWCRHALEHSVAPYFTLAGFHRALVPGGWLYVEVPAPETACHHETNPNHYSVLGQSAWVNLMQRAGFELLDATRIDLQVPAGPDVYWGFLARRAERMGRPAAAPPPALAADPRQEVNLSFPVGERTCRIELELDTREPSQALMASELAAGHFYEPDVSYFLTNVLQPGDTMIDVGGHVGYFSLLASQVVGPAGQVFTYEPEAANAGRLRGHLERNRAGNVIVLERALGEIAGEARLHVNADNAGGHALWNVGEFPTNDRSRARPETRLVPVGTLAELLDPTVGQRVRLVKIDAEGSEYRILKGGMLFLLAREVPHVICEINEFGLNQMGASGRTLRAFMAACGYTCYRLLPDAPWLTPFPPEEDYASPWVYNVLFTTQPIPA